MDTKAQMKEVAASLKEMEEGPSKDAAPTVSGQDEPMVSQRMSLLWFAFVSEGSPSELFQGTEIPINVGGAKRGCRPVAATAGHGILKEQARAIDAAEATCAAPCLADWTVYCLPCEHQLE